MNNNKLINTINEDIKEWERLTNAGRMTNSYLQLIVCSDSDTTGMYQLMLNGMELWYGTLKEINAIIKSEIIRMEYNDFLDMEDNR